MKQKLAILGASYLQLPLVLKAKQMGVETHCFAWDNAESVCKIEADYFYDISVLEKEKILEVCKRISINGITTIATDICVPTISFVVEALGLIGNSLASALCSTNKALMRARFAERGVPSPSFLKYTQAMKMELDGFQFPLIVKPTDRSGSLGVAKVNNQQELEDAIGLASKFSFEGTVVVEEYVEGGEVSVEYISWEGKHFFLSITDKVTTGAPHFVELEHHQPGLFSNEKVLQIKNVTEKALNSLDIKYGASHTELKICPDGSVVVVEVGARMGGDFIGSHLVPLSTGYDFLQGVVSCALGNLKKPSVSLNGAAGIYFLCQETAEIKPFFEKDNSFDIEKKILKEGLVRVSSSNERSGYLIYKANERLRLC